MRTCAGASLINLDNFLKHSSDKFNDWSKYKSHEYCDHSKLAAKNQCDYYDKYVMPNGMGSFRRAGIFAIAEKP